MQNQVLKQCWLDTFSWLFWTLVGSLMPLYGGYLLLMALQKEPDFFRFVDSGEFAIYSATMLAIAFHIIIKDYKTSTIKYKTVFAGICFLCILCSAILFSAFTVAGALDLFVDLNKDFMIIGSIVLYTISIILASLLKFMDENITHKDIREYQKDNLNKLSQEFDSLGG